MQRSGRRFVRSSWRATFVTAGTVLGLVAALVPGDVHGQPQGHVVRGVARDSVTGQALAGALVELRNPTDRATDRTDEAGNFRIRNVKPGAYRLSVLRIGFGEARRELVVGARDTSLVVLMQPVAQPLAAFRVRGDISAIYGMVAVYPDLKPLPETQVEVLGATQTRFTDSTGAYFIPVEKPGTYVVRMSHAGYTDRLFSIAVPKDRAVEASHMLNPGKAVESWRVPFYKEANERIRARGMNSAIVPGSDLRDGGPTLVDALQRSRAVTLAGLRVGDGCIFVDGVKKGPYFTLAMIRPEEVEAAELYAANGDNTGWLRKQCDAPRPGLGPGARTPPSGSNVVRYIVIWLRR